MAKLPDETKTTTRIMPCSCIHPWQDTQYGVGNRVHNWAKAKPSKEGGWVCTVCGKAKAK